MNFRTDRSCSLSSTQSITFLGRMFFRFLLLFLKFSLHQFRGTQPHRPLVAQAGTSGSGAIGRGLGSSYRAGPHDGVSATHQSIKTVRHLQTTSRATDPQAENLTAVRLLYEAAIKSRKPSSSNCVQC